jgi:hypothetical protein
MASGGQFATQDPKVISIFEIIGSYFVDCLYNHLHTSSRASLAGGASLTDEYVRQVQAFTIGAKGDEKCYGDLVQGVHRYFTGITRYTALSFGDFVDRIVGLCVPGSYYRHLRTEDKDELLSSVLCDLVSNLAALVTHPEMLRRVIDERETTPAVTVRMLQDGAINILLTKRAELHNKFLKKAGQARDTVPAGDVREAIRRLVKEKQAALAQVAALERKLRRALARENKLRELVDLLRGARAAQAAKPAAKSQRRGRVTVTEYPDEGDGGEDDADDDYTDEDDYSDEDDDYSDEDDEDEGAGDEEGYGADGPRGGTAPRAPRPEPTQGAKTKRAGRGAPRGRAPGPRARPTKTEAPTIGTSFFKAPLAPPPKGERAKPARGPAAPAQPPAMLSSLLDNVVDADALPDSTDL